MPAIAGGFHVVEWSEESAVTLVRPVFLLFTSGPPPAWGLRMDGSGYIDVADLSG